MNVVTVFAFAGEWVRDCTFLDCVFCGRGVM
jgi:hypothetical protein